jgi:hypothetical protein
MKLLQRWKQTALHNKALVSTSLLVAFGTLFYSGAAVLQLCILKQSGEQSDRQIVRVIDNMNWLARSMDLSAKNTQDALRASIEASRNDQRAWVGIMGNVRPGNYTDRLFLTFGSRTTFSIPMGNSGKSPALKVRFLSKVDSYRTDIPFHTNYEQPIVFHSVTVIQPGASTIVPTAPITVPVTQAAIDSVTGGHAILYLYGIVTYEDIFKRPHRTTFCMYLLPSLDTLASCSTYNEAN